MSARKEESEQVKRIALIKSGKKTNVFGKKKEKNKCLESWKCQEVNSACEIFRKIEVKEKDEGILDGA